MYSQSIHYNILAEDYFDLYRVFIKNNDSRYDGELYDFANS
jgi:hypothetical protein